MNFLKKLFGAKSSNKYESPEQYVEFFLGGVLDRMNIQCSFETKETKHGVSVSLFGEDENLLYKKDCQLLEALYTVVQKSIWNNFPNEGIKLDMAIRGQRQNKEQDMAKKVEDAVKKADSTKRPVFLDSMPPQERKLAHRQIEKHDHIRSHSVGEGRYKKIKIIPAKKT